MAFRNIKISVHPSLFLRDPAETELGRNLVKESISMIDTHGFEWFTFKKLAEGLSSTESSIYRYFENKHQLLSYLIGRYWGWLRFRIEFENRNLTDSKIKLLNIIALLATPSDNFPETGVDEAALHRIVVAEGSKVFLTRIVDELNREGMFTEYKMLCQSIADVVHECNIQYPYPHALASMLLETSRGQLYFAQHLPAMTDYPQGEDEYAYVKKYLEQLVFSVL
ncbi:MAG: TetR/AcrR family transcriptional regulator [Cytophagaceae bacterium]